MMICLSGEWDSYRAGELRRQLEPAYDSADVVINLSGARHVTGTLLGALLELHNHREERELEHAVVVVNSAFVRKVLEAAGYGNLFKIYDSAELLVPRVPPQKLEAGYAFG